MAYIDQRHQVSLATENCEISIACLHPSVIVSRAWRESPAAHTRNRNLSKGIPMKLARKRNVSLMVVAPNDLLLQQ